MLIYILSKLLSESFLSLYPVFVKNINLPILLQLWSRFFSYIIISLPFIDYKYILQNIISKDGLLLSIITTIHIYTSYRGFQLLESGIAYTIFYLYPLFILLLSSNNIHPILFFSIIGVYLLIEKQPYNILNIKKIEKYEDKNEKNSILSSTNYGVFMILCAAFTEAIIFFLIKRLNTNNNWNHLFLSYFIGAIGFSIYFLFNGFDFNNIITEKKIKITENTTLYYSLIINATLGLLGYLLRFYAISNLSAKIYAPLSYFGIFMSYIYGVLFNKDKITLTKIIGTIFILIPNIFILYRK